MEFRRNATRDDRRRRAILDDRNAVGRDADAASGEDGSNGKRARRYSSQALLERRVRIVDLIPLPWPAVGAYYLLGVVLISLLATLHYYASEKFAFANLSTVNSLGGWLAVIAFWTAAQTALVIYRIRRHRLDDYRGRYHVWLWAVAVLGLAGIDLLVDFRAPLGAMIEQASGRQFAELEHGWGLLIATVFYGIACLRIGWEVRASRGTLVVALLAMTTLGTFVAAKANLILWPSQLDATLTTCVLYLSGMWLLSMMLMQYARFVWMDAIGMIAARSAVEQADETAEKPQAKPARRRPTIVKQEAESAAEQEADEDANAGWFSWGGKKSKPAPADEVEKPAAAKQKSKSDSKPAAKQPNEDEAAPAEKKRGWFSFGRKQQADAETSAAAENEIAKPAVKSTPAKPTVIKKEAEQGEDAVPAKRSWFGFGRKQQTEAEALAAAEKEITKPTAKSTPAKPVVVKKAAAEQDADPAPKRGWFGFGAKKTAEDAAAEEQKPVKPAAKPAEKPAVKEPAVKEQAAEEKKSGWFGFGGKAKTEPEPTAEAKPAASPLASSARRAMVKQQQAETAAPAETLKMNPLTLGGGDQSDNESDDEIAMLEAKPDHLLSKAERRRLKKLKRRGEAA